jgi:CYTH domain-containing protein
MELLTTLFTEQIMKKKYQWLRNILEKSTKLQKILHRKNNISHEIERKFLVKELPKNLNQYESNQIIQHYLFIGDPQLRIRQKGNVYILTIKKWEGFDRIEVEFPLSQPEFTSLLPLSRATITKHRYNIPLDQWLTAELDIYILMNCKL